ncbi:ABC transporter substrate-binding protein [Lachnospiraceae bacterium NSJ-143]|nr:ABC transporter substrate-binding protein [Lachnospiraceae bacterium NSJ-143]
MKLKKLIAVAAAVVLSVASFAGCGSSGGKDKNEPDVTASGSGIEVTIEPADGNSETAESTEPVNIAMLKGPTAIGAVMLMSTHDNGTAEGNYNFVIDTAPDEVVSKIVSGEVDIAAVPSNSAAAIYNKTEGEVEVMAINTLGTLYLIENGDTINTAADLSGKTINSTGQGAVPEYVLNYLISESGAENVSVNFMQTHAELAAAVASGEAENALLPEPFAEVALSKNPDLRVALDIAKNYDEYSQIEKGDMPNTLPMGCVVVRKDYAKENPAKVDLFLEEYKKSIEEVNANVKEAAEYVVSYGIIDDLQVAESAIPKCSIYYIDGEKMKDIMESFLNVMNDANPKSIGGKLPEDDFYYIK